MICPKCGYNMAEDSDFCMNCGSRVERANNNSTYSDRNIFGKVTIDDNVCFCSKCGAAMPEDSLFCPKCGDKQSRQSRWKNYLIVGLAVAVAIVIIIIILIGRPVQSPVAGISQSVYDQGQDYIELMKSNKCRDKVISYAKDHTNTQFNEMYKHIEGVDFELDLGKKPSQEELYYAKVINKFWESWCIIYTHESIISNYNDAKYKVAVSVYKGILSDQEKKIHDAEELFVNADDMEDIEEAYNILDEVWEGDQESVL